MRQIHATWDVLNEVLTVVYKVCDSMRSVRGGVSMGCAIAVPPMIGASKAEWSNQPIGGCKYVVKNLSSHRC